VIEGAAAFVVWLGASLVVLSDGRRGLSAGVAVAAAGLAGVAFEVSGPIAAASLLAGGLCAAALRWRSGPPGWRVMPPGSTGWLILCIASAIFGLWIAAAVMTGQGGGLRFAALVTVVMMGARILSARGGAAGLSAATTVAMAIALAGALSPQAPGFEIYLAGAAVAVLITFVASEKTDAA